MKEFKEADHAFVFVEYSPKAPTKKLITKFAEKVWDTSEAEKGDGQMGAKKFVQRKNEFNIFALTDALGERNRARLWTLYQKALMQGSEPEEIHGILFWQVKSLLAAAQSKTAAEAGLKPFVWSKSQGFLRNYSLDELKKISSKMVGLYHLSRIESLDLEDELEEFVLQLK
jgi:DNA polymerase III delta subunit